MNEPLLPTITWYHPQSITFASYATLDKCSFEKAEWVVVNADLSTLKRATFNEVYIYCPQNCYLYISSCSFDVISILNRTYAVTIDNCTINQLYLSGTTVTP
jgi:hypothetical protein